MRNFCLALWISCCVFANVWSQTSLNMEYFGNWNDTTITVGFYGKYAACWGYTDPNGREYALMGAYTGTAIIDITDSTDLRKVAFISGPPSSWREMKTYRNYAYIVTEATGAGAGVQIVDLSQLPTSATLVKTYVWTDTIGGVPTAIPRAHTVSVNGKYLYLNGGNFNGIRILDLTDPVNPTKAGVYNGPYIHDSFIRNDTIYASAINSGGGLDIIDVRNKTNPHRVKLLQYTDSGTHNAWTTEDGNYVLTTDEIRTTPKSLKIWDIRDIQNPVKVSEFTNSISIVHNVFVKGNLAYVAWYADGLKVIDISNPANPQLVGYYDTYPGNPVAQYVGAWGADPFFPSGKVIVSDMQTGLYVVRYTGDKRGKLVGKVTNASGGGLIQDALLHFKEPSITRWTGSDGRYLFGYAPGTYNVLVEKPGYISKTIQATIRENRTDTVDVTLNSVATSASPSPSQQPTDYVLHQNYPNPFNPTTTIQFDLPQRTFVSLRLFNVLGQEVATLKQGVLEGGRHTLQVNAQGLASGVYLYRLETAQFLQSRRMVVTK